MRRVADKLKITGFYKEVSLSIIPEEKMKNSMKTDIFYTFIDHKTKLVR